MGISGRPLVHGPTVAGLKISVKVTCHKGKIYFCGKSWGSWGGKVLCGLGLVDVGLGIPEMGMEIGLGNCGSREFSTGVSSDFKKT